METGRYVQWRKEKNSAEHVTYAGDRCRQNTRLGWVGVGGLFVGRGYQIVS